MSREGATIGRMKIDRELSTRVSEELWNGQPKANYQIGTGESTRTNSTTKGG